MTDILIESILSGFDIPSFTNVSEIRNNVWDIDNAYILKKTNNFETLKKNAGLTRQLLEKDVLVAELIAAKAGEFYIKSDDHYYFLMHKLQGEHMDIYKGDYIKKAKQIGENTALLCRALESCVYDYSPRSEYDMIKYINGGYDGDINRGMISKKILCYINDFHPIYRKLPRQIIHKDLNPSNIMFDDAVFQGFIDFDMAQRNVRLYDICYLLQGVFQNEPDKIGISHEIVNCIYESYNRITPLTEEEKQAIPYMFVLTGALESIWTFNYGDNIGGDKKSISDFHVERTEWMFSNKHTFV